MSRPSCEEISAAVAARADQARDWLMQMISYPSTQGNEADCQAYIKELFEQVGWPAEYHQIPDELVDDPEYSHSEDEQPYDGRYNLVARRAGRGHSAASGLARADGNRFGGDGTSGTLQPSTQQRPGCLLREGLPSSPASTPRSNSFSTSAIRSSMG